MSIREDIRLAIKAAIESASLMVDDGAYPGQTDQYVVVAIANDEKDDFAETSDSDSRRLDIDASCYIKLSSSVGNLQSALDSMVSNVLSAVIGNVGVLNVCDDVRYDSLQQGLSDELEKSAAQSTIRLSAYYEASSSNPNQRVQ